jgi:hypothetical protein
MDMKLTLKLLIIGFCLVFLSGCVRVQQIDRGRLARKIMKTNPMPKQQGFMNEVHSIREAAAGGTDKNAGGGCGCN